MNQLKSVYNIPFLDSYSHPIHTCLSMIASNKGATAFYTFDVSILGRTSGNITTRQQGC